ncbi:mRNA splicing protein [Hypoxylon texense]
MKPVTTLLLIAAGAAAGVAADELLTNFQSNVSHGIYNIRVDVVNIQNTLRDLQPQPSDELLAKGQALYKEYQDLAYAADAKLINIIDWSYEYEKEIGQK